LLGRARQLHRDTHGRASRDAASRVRRSHAAIQAKSNATWSESIGETDNAPHLARSRSELSYESALSETLCQWPSSPTRTSDIEPGRARQSSAITVVPLFVVFGDRSYRDNGRS
jgi:hypothetical protein